MTSPGPTEHMISSVPAEHMMSSVPAKHMMPSVPDHMTDKTITTQWSTE